MRWRAWRKVSEHVHQVLKSVNAKLNIRFGIRSVKLEDWMKLHQSGSETFLFATFLFASCLQSMTVCTVLTPHPLPCPWLNSMVWCQVQQKAMIFYFECCSSRHPNRPPTVCMGNSNPKEMLGMPELTPEGFQEMLGMLAARGYLPPLSTRTAVSGVP